MESGHVAKRARTTPTATNGKPTASVNFTSEKLPFVKLTNAAGDSVKAYPFGACITSYVKGGKETLAMRADNKMDGSKPISGGIPHCFPQFGPGVMQQHGFARNCVWDVAEITDGPDEPSVVFTLKDTAYTRSMWDFAFEVRYTIELGSDSLDTTFSVLNKGDVPFQFTAALHSYWAVSTVPNITVSGPFKGASYLDKSVDPPVTRTGEANDLTISKATDSVYQDVWGDLKITDRRDASVLGIKASGWTDTVVWNPLKESMGSSKFVCVECAKAAQPVTVPPGAEWVAAMLVTPGQL